MSEFTKGKWEYWKDEKYPYWYVGKTGASRYLATVDKEANARLIAAAPEMFELLLSLSYRTSGMEQHEVSKIREILTLIEGKEITSHGYYKN